MRLTYILSQYIRDYLLSETLISHSYVYVESLEINFLIVIYFVLGKLKARTLQISHSLALAPDE